MRIIKAPTAKLDLINTSENFIDEHVIKAVVDIKRKVVAVDAPMHYDCEQLLLEDGSAQSDLWGVNLYLDEDELDNLVEFDLMINIRPAEGNRSRSVENPDTRDKIKSVIAKWLR